MVMPDDGGPEVSVFYRGRFFQKQIEQSAEVTSQKRKSLTAL